MSDLRTRLLQACRMGGVTGVTHVTDGVVTPEKPGSYNGYVGYACIAVGRRNYAETRIAGVTGRDDHPGGMMTGRPTSRSVRPFVSTTAALRVRKPSIWPWRMQSPTGSAFTPPELQIQGTVASTAVQLKAKAIPSCRCSLLAVTCGCTSGAGRHGTAPAGSELSRR